MSETNVMMKFEFLPNEILIECFQYLNVLDIFNSFDQLNKRYFKLIRSLSFHLNFQHIKKSLFDQFTQKMLINSEIKNQIFSLTLSNENDTCCQIELFLSLFSLNEFSYLQSLSLICLKENQIKQIQNQISSLTNLSYFYASDEYWNSELFSALPLLTIQTLTLPLISNDFIVSESSIRNLTIYRCSWDCIYRILKYLSNLKYLKIESFSQNFCSEFDVFNFNKLLNVSLTKLITSLDLIQFDHLEILLKNLKNLKSLNLVTYNCKDMFDSYRWQSLILSSLPHLFYFKFNFRVRLENEYGIDCTRNNVLEKFQYFQNDFWHKQHQWYTQCHFDKRHVFIYTIPFIGNEFEITSFTNIYSYSLSNHLNIFNNVQNLIIFPQVLKNQFQFYFSNIKTLKLQCQCYDYMMDDNIILTIKDIDSMKRFFNFSNLEHLDIDCECQFESPLVLLYLLKQAPKILSLSIDYHKLISLCNNKQLCNYFNTFIQKLEIKSAHYLFSSRDLESLCQVFSNLQQIQCIIDKLNDLLILLDQLPKLRSIISNHLNENADGIDLWLKNNIEKRKKTSLFQYSIRECHRGGPDSLNHLHIWL